MEPNTQINSTSKTSNDQVLNENNERSIQDESSKQSQHLNHEEPVQIPNNDNQDLPSQEQNNAELGRQLENLNQTDQDLDKVTTYNTGVYFKKHIEDPDFDCDCGCFVRKTTRRFGR